MYNVPVTHHELPPGREFASSEQLGELYNLYYPWLLRNGVYSPALDGDPNDAAHTASLSAERIHTQLPDSARVLGLGRRDVEARAYKRMASLALTVHKADTSRYKSEMLVVDAEPDGTFDSGRDLEPRRKSVSPRDITITESWIRRAMENAIVGSALKITCEEQRALREIGRNLGVLAV